MFRVTNAGFWSWFCKLSLFDTIISSENNTVTKPKKTNVLAMWPAETTVGDQTTARPSAGRNFALQLCRGVILLSGSGKDECWITGETTIYGTQSVRRSKFFAGATLWSWLLVLELGPGSTFDRGRRRRRWLSEWLQKCYTSIDEPADDIMLVHVLYRHGFYTLLLSRVFFKSVLSRVRQQFFLSRVDCCAC